MAATSPTFDAADFEKRLLALKDTQESIQQLSTWCLQHRASHKKLVSSWLNILKQVKIENRLTLFYLANDVIQYSKRKNYEFVDSWGTSLQRAVTMVRADERVKNKILRIFKIWEQRGIYNEEFLADLNGLLSVPVAPPKKPVTPAKEKPKEKSEKSEKSEKIESTKELAAPIENSDEFQPAVLNSHIRSCVKLESETDKSLKMVVKATIPDIEEMRSSMKDRKHVEDAEKEVDDSVHNFSKFIHNLKSEIKARNLLLTALEQAEGFYHNQRGEVKVVANAYRNFGNRIKTMKKKLDELVVTLPSPMPSPDINAPSPEPDNDFELPDSQFSYFNATSNSGFMSYMGGGELPFDINDFRRESPTRQNEGPGNSAQPIQVINSSNDYALTEFFKTLIPDTYISPETTANLTSSINYLAQQQQQQQQQMPPHSQASQSYNVPQTNYSPVTTSAQNYGVGGPPLLPKGMANFGYNPNMNTGYGGNQPPPSLLPPPPIPPINLDNTDEYDPAWVEMGNWSSSQESLTFNQIETPISPPHFEQEGLNTDLIEYIDTVNDELRTGISDVDHRQLPVVIPTSNNSAVNEGSRKVDVDHRNLISLTGSPGNHPKIAKDVNVSGLWTSQDVDFRFSANMKAPPPPIPPQALINSALTTIVTTKPLDSDYRIPAPLDPGKKSALLHPPPPPPKMPLLQPPPLLHMEDFPFLGSDNDMRFPIKPQETISSLFENKEISQNKTGSSDNTAECKKTVDSNAEPASSDEILISSQQSKRTIDESVDMDFSDDDLLDSINKDGNGTKTADNTHDQHNQSLNNSLDNNSFNDTNMIYNNEQSDGSFEQHSDTNNGIDANNSFNPNFSLPPPRMPLLPNPGMMMTPPPPRNPFFNSPNNGSMGLLGNRPGMWDTPPPLLGMGMNSVGSMGGERSFDGSQDDCSDNGHYNNYGGHNQQFQNNNNGNNNMQFMGPRPVNNRGGGGGVGFNNNNDFRQNSPFRGGNRGGRFNGGGGGGSPYFRGRGGGGGRGRGGPFRGGGNMQQRGGKW